MFDKFYLKPYKRVTQPLLTAAQRTKRIKFSTWWRQNHVKLFGNKPIMFSDEKVFSVNGGLNKQNDRIYATSREQANSYDG